MKALNIPKKNRWIANVFFSILGLVLLCSFAHKFYVGIFQIEHNVDKKRLEITCRIFADDLDRALKKRYGKDFWFAEIKADAKQQEEYALYINEKFRIGINGKSTPIQFKSFEVKDNVMIGYFVVQNVTKIKSMQLSNTALMEIEDAQQNIMQIRTEHGKKSVLLVSGKTSESLEF